MSEEKITRVPATHSTPTTSVERVQLTLHTTNVQAAENTYSKVNRTNPDSDTTRLFGYFLPYDGPNPFTVEINPTDSDNALVNTIPNGKERAIIESGGSITRSLCLFG